MKVNIFENRRELEEACAMEMVFLLKQKPNAKLGLATGETPLGIYQQLIRLYQQQKVSFCNVTTFNLDEYVGLPENHLNSYHYYMKQHLFQYIDVPMNQAYLPNGLADDLQAECNRYDHLLQQARQLDMQLLGIGHNGHIGFNEPSSDLFARTHLVKLSDETRNQNARYFPAFAHVPTHAITMGVANILQAKTILLVAFGASKASIIAQALKGPITTNVPASLLQLHANLIVMVDREAGRELV
jgi:glucosamine-6-phosphate deaminase